MKKVSKKDIEAIKKDIEAIKKEMTRVYNPIEYDQSYWSQTDDAMVEILNLLFDYLELYADYLWYKNELEFFRKSISSVVINIPTNAAN